MSPLQLVLQAVGTETVNRALDSVANHAREMGGDVQGAAREAAKASDSLDGIGRSANNLERNLQGAGRATTDAMRDVDKGADRARDSIRGVEGEASKLDDSLTDVGRNRGLDDLGDSADDLGDKIGDSTDKVSGFVQTLEKARAAGMGLTAAGAGGVALSNKLIQEAEDGDGMQSRLQSILKAQGRAGDLDTQNNIIQDITVRGHFEGDDEIANGAVLLNSFSVETQHMGEMLELSGRQARTMGSDIKGVAAQLGKAYNTGKVAPLSDSGVVISPSEMKRIEDAYKVSQKLGQQTFVDVLGPAIRANTVALADSLTASKAAANDAARAVGDFYGNVGQGSMNAQAQINGVVASIFELANASDEIERSSGTWLTYGSYAATAGGAVLTVGSQAAITAASLSTLGVTGTSVMAAIRLAALGTTGSVLGLAGAALFAVAAISAAVYSWNVNRDKIMNPTQSHGDNRTGAQVADDNGKRNKIDALNSEANEMPERDRMVLKRKISRAYFDLGENDASGDANSEANALKKSLGRNFKEPVSARGRAMAAELAKLNAGANRSARFGDSGFKGYQDSSKSKEQKEQEQLQANLAKGQAELDAKTKANQTAIAGGSAPAGDLSAFNLGQLQTKAARGKSAGAKDLAQAQLEFEISLRRRAEKDEKESLERVKSRMARAPRSSDAANASNRAAPKMPPTIETAAILAKAGAAAPLVSTPPISLASSVGAPPMSELSELGSELGTATSSAFDVLRFVESGGSLYNVPTGDDRQGGAAPQGASGGARGERTGALDLRETSRKTSGGIERVTVTGTLDLEEGGTLAGAALGFRL